MASFTETATLKVVDQSSAEIKAINSALKALVRTTKKLTSASVKFDVKTTGLAQATAMVGKLALDAKALKSTAASIKVKVDTTEAKQQLAALKKNVQQAGRAARGGGGVAGDDEGTGRRRRRGPTAGQYAHSAAQGVSSGLGLGIPLGGHPALMALEVAAYAAAKGLQAVATATAKRDRAELQAAVGATPDQRKILMADMANRAKDRGPLPLTDAARLSQQVSLLGDVVGKNEKDRARAAINISDYIEKEIIPRQFALNPEKSFDEVQQGARKIVQALNLASTGIVNEADKYEHGILTERKGELSKEGKRAADAVQLAQSADPDLSPQLIKTTMANLKSAAFALDTTALAKVLMNAGARGQRAANELFRAQQVLTGTVDVKAMNNQLADMKLLQGYSRNKKGNVIAGSGRAVDAELLQRNPYQWVDTYLRPQMMEELKKQSEARYRKTGRPEDREVTQGDMTEYVNRKFAGASSAARQGLSDIVLGDAQANQQLQQAQDAIRTNRLPDALRKSLVAQWTNLKTQLESRAADVGTGAAQKLGLTDKINQLTDAINHPTGEAVKGVLGNMANIMKTLGMSELQTAGSVLIIAGRELTNAANKLMKKPEDNRTVDEIKADVAHEDNLAQQAAAIKDANEARKRIEQAQSVPLPKDARSRANVEADRAAIVEREKAARVRLQQLREQLIKAELDKIRANAEKIDASDIDLAVETENAIAESVKPEMHKVLKSFRRQQLPMKEVPLPRARPTDLSGEPVPTVPLPVIPESKPPELPDKLDTKEMVPGIEALKKSAELIDQSSTRMATATTSFGTATSNFNTAFDSGTTKLAGAGKTAVSDMEGGAGNIGRLIAAAFVAGASGVKVGVDTSGVVSAGYKSPSNKGNLPVSI